MDGVSVISRDTTIPATSQAIWDVLADFGELVHGLAASTTRAS
jgi:hypothetical protein